MTKVDAKINVKAISTNAVQLREKRFHLIHTSFTFLQTAVEQNSKINQYKTNCITFTFREQLKSTLLGNDCRSKRLKLSSFMFFFDEHILSYINRPN